MATGRNWPGAPFPQITNLPGARREPPDGIARSSLEGAPQQRRRTHADDPRIYRDEILVTAAQRAEFLTFFRTTLGNGALSFDHIDSFDGSAARLKFTGGPPPITPAGDGDLYWVIGLRLLEIAT